MRTGYGSIAVWLCVLGSVARGVELPNFLVVIADDCTYRDLECYGGQARTPHLNRLCAQGLKFTQCFQAAPMCSPTRHCLYTGLYPVSSGAYPNHTFVKEGTRSIAHYLKAAGYRVALSGKKHINPRESFPFEYSGRNNPDFDAVDRLLAECTKENTPFCVFACSNEPHTPWNKGDASAYPPHELRLPPFFVDTPATRQHYATYLAEITYFDGQVGRLLDLLQKHNVARNTLVMVLSEQGNSFPFAKWTCYEMGLQSAMIVRWPGIVEAGSTTRAMVEYVDVVPTLLAAAAIAQPEGLEGKSFLPVLRGNAQRHKAFVYGLQTTRGIINGSPSYGVRSVRSPDYRYILNLTPDAEFRNVVRRSIWWKSWEQQALAGDEHARDTIARYTRRPREELYDVRRDPFNRANLAEKPELASIKAELRQQLEAWMEAQGDEGQATELAAEERQWKRRQR